MLNIREGSGVCHVHIEGELSIYHAAEYKPQLLAALERQPLTEINLSAVTELDSAGVQLLLLTKREAQRRGRTLRLVAHSEASLQTIDVMGLAGYFGDPLIVAESRSEA